MSRIDAEGKLALKKLGYTDEMIEKLENKPPPKTKRCAFVPTPKKMLRISHCLFCNHTRTTYYVLDEISFAAWEGHEVSRDKYMETKGIKAKPSNYKTYYCTHCVYYIETLSLQEMKKALLNIMKPDIGRVLC